MPAEYSLGHINTMLNTPYTTQRGFGDSGVYGCLQNTYNMANLVGFKSTTPGVSGYKYVPWPGTPVGYITAYADGRITATQDNGVATDYWFYVFGSGYSGAAYEVYCATGSGSGTIVGDTRDAWITIGATYRRWGVSGNGDRYFYLYFRNSYFAQTSPGTCYMYCESVI